MQKSLQVKAVQSIDHLQSLLNCMSIYFNEIFFLSPSLHQVCQFSTDDDAFMTQPANTERRLRNSNSATITHQLHHFMSAIWDIEYGIGLKREVELVPRYKYRYRWEVPDSGATSDEITLFASPSHPEFLSQKSIENQNPTHLSWKTKQIRKP